MKAPQTKADLERLIADRVEESLQLEYKDARSLATDGKKNPKTEIAKDVSAMANSAGGIVVYGMKEYDDAERQHLPEKITPIDRKQFSKEWLEQVINSNINPRIGRLEIHPVPLDNLNEVVYVLEIPQSTTAHQNVADYRYYKRYNFLAVPMPDYEIRDIMNRTKNPVIELDFKIDKHVYEAGDPLGFARSPFNQKPKEVRTVHTLWVRPHNVGVVYAQYVSFSLVVPEGIVAERLGSSFYRQLAGIVTFQFDNTHRDVVDVEVSIGANYPKYGPSRFHPVLPGLKGPRKEIDLVPNPILDDRAISWTVHADNAVPTRGSVKLSDIPVIERDESAGNG